MTLKYSAASNFAVCILCTIAALRLPISGIALLLAVCAVVNAWFFVVNLCNHIERQLAAQAESRAERKLVAPARR
jgi:hypothetical protein